MRIYVASSWRNQYQQAVVQRLRGVGCEVYDFRGGGDGWSPNAGEGGFSWSEVDPEWKSWPDDVPRYLAGLDHPRAVEGYRRDMDALIACDACVMVMPCGPSASMEMGWACGAGKFVIVYMPGIREPDLMVKMADHVTDDFHEVLRLLGDFRRNQRGAQQRAVARWFDRNGGNRDTAIAINRMLLECRELVGAAAEGNPEKVEEESADVGLMMMLIAECGGFDLEQAMRRKHAVNEQRKWMVDEYGCLTHVQEKPSC